MPHSESQLIGDLVKETQNPIVRQIPVKSIANNLFNDKNENIVVPRPPLPPKISIKSSKLKNVKKVLPNLTTTTNSNDSLAQIALNSVKSNARVSLTRSDINNNNNNAVTLSRNSSNQSIDSMSSFRSISPSISMNSSIGSISSRHSLFSLNAPRRIFPQTYKPSKTIDLSELKKLDSASTVFDGKLSFIFGCKQQPVRQEFRSSPAHLSEAETASRYLSDKINSFLMRTDHVKEEWNQRCKSVSRSSVSRNSCDVIDDDINKRLGRSKSVTNIMIKSYQMAKSMPPTERSNSICRDSRCDSVFSYHNERKKFNDNDDADTIIDDEVYKQNICKNSLVYVSIILINCFCFFSSGEVTSFCCFRVTSRTY